MLLNIFISFLIIPSLNQDINFDGYLMLEDNQKQVEIQELAPQRVYTDVLDVKTTAQSAIAVDLKTGKILYEKNSQEIRPIASLTKLMTALVFLDNNPGWEKEILIKASDRRNGGIIHLNIGESISIRDLFRTALIASDNDATAALSRSTGMGQGEFADLMNQKAHKLGLSNTTFIEPTGLNSNNQSTAQEIVKLLNVALKNQEIAKVTTMPSYEFEVQGIEKTRTVKVINTDRLTNSYLDILGGKTGHLEESGWCLGVKIKGENDQKIVVVVLGSQTNFDRFQDIKAISDLVFINYKWQ